MDHTTTLDMRRVGPGGRRATACDRDSSSRLHIHERLPMTQNADTPKRLTGLLLRMASISSLVV